MHTYLVTVARRGIGKALIACLAKRKDVIVIAAVRSLDTTTKEELERIPKASGSKFIAVKIDSSDFGDAKKAATSLEHDYQIEHIDTIIANAGVSKADGPALSITGQELLEHFQINAIGVLALFQAFWPLLQRSATPKFVALSSGLASIGDMGSLPLPCLAYGTSKAALNYIVRKVHFEHDGLIAFVVSPGWVQTDMGNAGAVAAGMKEAPVTVEQSVQGTLVKLDRATRESTSGTFQSFDETQYSW